MNIDEKYINEVLVKNSKLNVDMIKKDLILSYILQELSVLDNLIFKGGTCLSKTYLKYHRLSEDLDFNLEIGPFESKTKFKREVRTYFKEVFLVKLQEIANKYNLDFDKDEFSTDGNRYCPVKSGDNIFIFYIYLDLNDKNPIKIEVNISEDRQFDFSINKIVNLNSNSKYLIYPLKDVKIKCYSLDEIILEKIRALLTRQEGIHERDIFDLFLINNIQNIFSVDKVLVIKKLSLSFLFDSAFVKKRMNSLNKYKLFEEIENLSIIEFDFDSYTKFFEELLIFCNNLILTVLPKDNFKQLE